MEVFNLKNKINRQSYLSELNWWLIRLDCCFSWSMPWFCFEEMLFAFFKGMIVCCGKRCWLIKRGYLKGSYLFGICFAIVSAWISRNHFQEMNKMIVFSLLICIDTFSLCGIHKLCAAQAYVWSAGLFGSNSFLMVRSVYLHLFNYRFALQMSSITFQTWMNCCDHHELIYLAFL